MEKQNYYNCAKLLNSIYEKYPSSYYNVVSHRKFLDTGSVLFQKLLLYGDVEIRCPKKSYKFNIFTNNYYIIVHDDKFEINRNGVKSRIQTIVNSKFMFPSDKKENNNGIDI